MTLSQFEIRLKEANPRLHIKRYGSSKAGVHLGNQFICRVPQGEITAYNVVKEEIGHSTSAVTEDNPYGEYKFDLIIRRGRWAVARILQGKRIIKQSDIANLAK